MALKHHINTHRHDLFHLDEWAAEIDADIAVASACPGTIHATGCGKSSRVASMFAEDLATLGVSSVYIPSGDLLHGGIGRVQDGDSVFFFSHSGRTQELLEASDALYVNTASEQYLVTGNPDHHFQANDIVYHIPDHKGLPNVLVPMIIARAIATKVAEHRNRDHHWTHPA